MIVHDAVNRVVRLRIGETDCALRFPKLVDRDMQVDRFSERVAIQTAAKVGLAPEIVACDPESGVLVTRWIDEPVWTPGQTHDHDSLRTIAAVLRSLHELPPPNQVRTLDLKNLAAGYWRTLAPQRLELPPALSELNQQMLAVLDHRVTPDPRLCHNDLHCGNIIGKGCRVRLLDWEYAGLGDPLFDLASYSQTNDLTTEQQRELLRAYGKGVEDSYERFRVECRLFDWICLLWLAACDLRTMSAAGSRFTLLLKRSAAAVMP